jgi:hypothetical protein
MTGRREFFTELNSDVRDSVKFGDASGVEIKGIGVEIKFRRGGMSRDSRCFCCRLRTEEGVGRG